MTSAVEGDADNAKKPSDHEDSFRILIFRYVSLSDSTCILKRYGTYGLPELPRSDEPNAPGSAGANLQKMWDYPLHRSWSATAPRELVSEFSNGSNIAGRELRLVSYGCALVPDPPDHYPIPYTFYSTFEYQLKKDDKLDDLEAVSMDAKRIARDLCPVTEFDFTPIFWFTPKEFSSFGRSNLSSAAVRTTQEKAQVYRVFGKASYHVVGATVDSACGSVVDLGLISSVTHLVERYHRRYIHVDVLQALKSLFEQSERVEPDAQNSAMPRILQRLHDSRLKLARLRGLITRILQMYGQNEGSKTLFDIVGNDAESALNNEYSVSIQNASLLVEAIHNTNSLRSQKESNRIARIGQYIQSTLAAGLFFQIGVTIFPTSTGWRNILLVAAALGVFFLMSWFLRRQK